MTDSADEAATRLGLVQAPIRLRITAFGIDLGILIVLAAPAVIGGLMLAGARQSVLPVVLIVAGAAAVVLFAVVQLLVHGRRGVTAGKAAVRLRSVAVDDFGRPGIGRIMLRAVVLWASGLLPLVGPAVMFASSLWDPGRRGRSILDRVARCWLIDVRAGLDPFDATALRRARRALHPAPADTGERLAPMASGVGVEDGLRVPEQRSRAGVVGLGGTGARWERADSRPAPALIDEVPGAPDRDPAPEPEPAPGPAPAAASPPTRRRDRPMLRFDDGSLARVPARGLVGRDPEPAAGESADALIRLDDPERLMSKTHAGLGFDGDGVWVRDRSSRNGTRLRSPGGDEVDLAAGETTRVPDGWTVQVGGRSFTVITRESGA